MLTDHVIIITGASSGIGAATAIEAARQGMDVVITARREDKLNDVASRVRALNRRCEIVVGDVSYAGMSERLLDTAQRTCGRFDAVFANAGYGLDRTMLDITERELRDMFEVNFFAGVDLLQKAGRQLIDAKREGHLLMCSSCIGKFTLPHSGAYCATKAAQNHFCRAMRIELAPQKIHVASVHPIGTWTEFSDAAAQRSGKGAGEREGHTPGMFMQPPERVARAVIKCLKRPKPEVWTSFLARMFAGVLTMSPRFADFMMRVADRAGHR
jgi:short-subunit dehydrogenase